MTTYIKKLNIFDKIRNKFMYLTGYKEGQRFILDVPPFLRNYSDIELMKLASIEQKLQEALLKNELANSLISGITTQEAEQLLEWVVQNARNGLFLDGKKSTIDSSLSGYCGLGQAITGLTLLNMGLSPNIVNASTIFNSGGHAFIVTGIPIKDETKVIDEKLYLVDTTYRQFFLRENNIFYNSTQYIRDKRYGNKVAPSEGYWVLQVDGGKDFSKELLSKGFIAFTEENAKIYGDSFVLSSRRRKKNSRVPRKSELVSGITGKQYINRILDSHMHSKLINYEEDMYDYEINIVTPLMQKEEINQYNSPISSSIDLSKFLRSPIDKDKDK